MDNFYEIKEDDDPKLVDTVSELRHYINIWGITKKLLGYFETDWDTIVDICDNIKGYEDVEDAIENLEQLKEEYQQERDAKLEAWEKNWELQEILQKKQKTFCNNLGIRKIKTLLTKLSKTNNIAKLLRLCLEVETVNIKAKEDGIDYYPGFCFNHTCKEMLYYKKENILKELMTLCQDNNIIYGLQETDNYSANAIVYFEFPNTKQISYHMNLCNINNYPKYEKEWDGLVNSTLNKLEESIQINFPEICK